MAKRVDLFIIDGQNDFCASGNEPAEWPTPFGGKPARGALYVEGADKEALLVEEMLDRLVDPNLPHGHKITKLHSTLDSHHYNDCAHNTAWKGPDGKSPPPFTIISHADVVTQRWVPRFSIGIVEGKVVPSYKWALYYTEALEKLNRNPLCAWPPHCLIQSWGASVYYPLQRAYQKWAEVTNGWVDWISKGQWPWTEHYGGFRADVPDPTRPETQLNVSVINDAMQADIVVWCGWAGSHCLKWTAIDALNHFGQGSNDFIKKSVFLSDASAAVANIPGAPFKFSDWRQQFLDEVAQRGATVTTTKEFLK